MKSLYLAALALFAGCAATTVDVTPLHPSPRALAARPPATVMIYKTEAPTGAIEIYRLDAQDGSADERAAALRAKAAELGCDGLVVHVETATERRDEGQSQTGQLNDHRVIAPAHLSATCVVLPGTDPGTLAR